jgi:hypothetical protein
VAGLIRNSHKITFRYAVLVQTLKAIDHLTERRESRLTSLTDRTTAITSIYILNELHWSNLTDRQRKTRRTNKKESKLHWQRKRGNKREQTQQRHQRYSSSLSCGKRLDSEAGPSTFPPNRTLFMLPQRLPLRQNVLRYQIQCGPVYSYIYAARFRFTNTETQVLSHHILPSI